LLLEVSNFDDSVVYPSDSYNNTLLNYNNNVIKVEVDTGIISIDKNNFITSKNYSTSRLSLVILK
jgi:hypothetical protein